MKEDIKYTINFKEWIVFFCWNSNGNKTGQMKYNSWEKTEVKNDQHEQRKCFQLLRIHEL